jgi:hypothetical protein
MSVMIDITNYPLLQKLPDPERVLRSWIDIQYSLFASQQRSHPQDDLVQSVQEMCTTLTETTDKFQHQLETIESNQRNHVLKVDQTLNQLPILLAKSHTRGTIGESSLLEFLKGMLPENEYILETTAQQAHSGDILLCKRDISILLDAKLYSHVVPKKEVEKLKFDMIAKNVRIGILVSFNSNVRGFTTSDFVFFRNETGHLHCLAILGSITSSPSKLILCIQILESLYERVLKQDSVSIQTETHSKSILKLVLDSADELSGLTTSFGEIQKDIHSLLSKQKDSLFKAITRHQEQVRSLCLIVQ